jgi:hypothetical protein
MEPEAYFINPDDDTLQLESNMVVSTDVKESSSIMDVMPNYAEDSSIVEKTKNRIKSLFSNIRDRSELESIWEKNDSMYRIKPDPSKDDVHRANESTGVFHIAVNQLVSMAFKTFTDNPDNYKFGYFASTEDEQVNIVKSKNAEILTMLFRRAQSSTKFKKNLKRVLLDIYKNGNGIIGIPWEKIVVDTYYRDKDSGERKIREYVQSDLPAFEFIPLDKVWMDENIDEIELQPGVFIKNSISWNQLFLDSKKQKVKLFENEGDGLKNKLDKYRERLSSLEYNNPKSERMDNAGRTFEDRSAELYEHWTCWVNLPIDKDNSEWNENNAEIRCRVRFLGNPDSCDIIEIRENIFPNGLPILMAHQTEDDIGSYHISLGEKVETYYDQICIATDQLIDNRSKNCRRPIVYDPLRMDGNKYDFGHSNTIPCTGDVKSAFTEMQLLDMTGTISQSIQYYEQKFREITNTTEAVIGQAMGGRTSASEYVGARTAATTPIFSDMASIEDALIGEYMKKFAQCVHAFMTHEDIVKQIGSMGAEFQFDLSDIYLVELRGVAEAMDKATKIQSLMQLFGMTQDMGIKSKITLRIAETMGLENPAQFVAIPAKDQAIKAALWENNEILVFAQYDEPEQGEMHDVHLPVHRQALWQAQREKNPNAPMMQQHISLTEQLKKSEQALSGANSFPGGQGVGPSSSTLASAPITPGQEEGQVISGQMGNMNGGSPIPSE